MRLGTTPTHTFDVPFPVDTIRDLRIVYAQAGSEVLVKEKYDCEMEGHQITVKLTQEDTFLFNPNLYVEAQIRVLTIEGEVMASDIVRINPYRVLGEEVAL